MCKLPIKMAPANNTYKPPSQVGVLNCPRVRIERQAWYGLAFLYGTGRFAGCVEASKTVVNRRLTSVRVGALNGLLTWSLGEEDLGPYRDRIGTTSNAKGLFNRRALHITASSCYTVNTNQNQHPRTKKRKPALDQHELTPLTLNRSSLLGGGGPNSEDWFVRKISSFHFQFTPFIGQVSTSFSTGPEEVNIGAKTDH